MKKYYNREYINPNIKPIDIYKKRLHPMNDKKLTDFVLKEFDKKHKILDVGCNKGYDVYYFIKKGFDVSGCDISETAIRMAKKSFPRIKFFVHNFENKPTKEKYDCIYSFDVIEHIFYTDSFIKNIYQSLNKNGKFILALPNVLSLRNRINFLLGRDKYFDTIPHIRFFGINLIKEKLKNGGFEKIRWWWWGVFKNPVFTPITMWNFDCSRT
jgi:2-polyprenyl-3-methyl-5-hydroxy-6-metoxy-1,4-benzoquinol methylase